MKNILKILKRNERAILPQKATSGSAGADLYACIEERVKIEPGQLVKIPTGISISIPSDCVALIFSRSGLGIKHGITLSNGVGVVDSDYRWEICVGLCNVSSESYEVSPNDRIAQMIIMKTENFIINEVSSLDATQRGEQGFGSSGK